jgi:hypothetical protein
LDKGREGRGRERERKGRGGKRREVEEREGSRHTVTDLLKTFK